MTRFFGVSIVIVMLSIIVVGCGKNKHDTEQESIPVNNKSLVIKKDFLSSTDRVGEKQSYVIKYAKSYPATTQKLCVLHSYACKMLYNALKDDFTKEEVNLFLSKNVVELDEFHLKKIRFIAAPSSRRKQRRQHKDYVPILVNQESVAAGVQLFWKKKDTFQRAYARTYVEPQDILAILNWESKLGKHTGKYKIFKIFIGQIFLIDEIEQDFFEKGAYNKRNVMKRSKALKRIVKLQKRAAKNLAALLRIAKEQNFNPFEIRGSWAGAIGYPQFMPQSMIYAADGNGDGTIDLNNMDDAIASIASYLVQHGYRTRGKMYAFKKYNPEAMYIRGVRLYSDMIAKQGIDASRELMSVD